MKIHTRNLDVASADMDERDYGVRGWDVREHPHLFRGYALRSRAGWSTDFSPNSISKWSVFVSLLLVRTQGLWVLRCRILREAERKMGSGKIENTVNNRSEQAWGILGDSTS